MCGIFGYVGKQRNASKVLLHGLQKLEYRGYDSAGFAVGNESGKIDLVKSVGKVSALVEKAQNLNKDEKYTFGIAHTRWATHGGVTENNCHPHYDSDKKFYLVHNGIIENYHELKEELIFKGYEFYGQTDSEVLAKYMEYSWQGSLMKTVEHVLPKLEGAYALLFISKENPEEIIGVKYGSPLVFGFNQESQEFFFSSDTQALVGYAEELIFLDDGDLIHVINGDYLIKSEGRLVVKPIEKIDVSSLGSDKGTFEHFMLKEIHEQPRVLEDVLRGRVDFEDFNLISSSFRELDKHDFEKVVFIACGTSYHAGWLGTFWFEDLADMDARVEVASEFEYKNLKIDSETLYVFISQSGETADSIGPLKYIKSKGGHTFGIVNVVGSTISRLTDYGLFTRAGTEVGVASSKAFTAQITSVLLLALYFSNKRSSSRQKYVQVLTELRNLPQKIQQIIDSADSIEKIAHELIKYKQFFFLGRHLELPVAFESSLKFKEISYLNSQTLPTGELKHGSLALIDKDFPSILFAPKNFLFDKNLSSIQEIKARNGKVLAITDGDIPTAEWQIKIPETIDTLYPFLLVVAGQFLAYHTANLLGHEIDKPRNLAKSVTVK